jgi:hypothetical protein
MAKQVIGVQSNSITADKLTKDVMRGGFVANIVQYNTEASLPTDLPNPQRVLFVSPTFVGFQNPYFSKIQDALDAIDTDEGWLVIVYAGTYPENLIIDNDNVTINCVGSVTLDCNLTASGSHGIIVDANNFRLLGNLRITENSDGFVGLRLASGSVASLEFDNISVNGADAISNASAMIVNIQCNILSSIYANGLFLHLKVSNLLGQFEAVNNSTFNVQSDYINRIKITTCAGFNNIIIANSAINPSGLLITALDSFFQLFNLAFETSQTTPIVELEGSGISLINCSFTTANNTCIELTNNASVASVTLRNSVVIADTNSIAGVSFAPSIVNYLNQGSVKPDTLNVSELNFGNKTILV